MTAPVLPKADLGRAVGQGSIITPEAVVLDFDLAGVASRTLSAGIDIAVQFAVMIGIAMLSGIIGGANAVAGIVAVLVGIILVLFGYPIAMETLNGGRSLGRMVVGTRVVTIEGAPVGLRHSFIRALLSIVDLLASLGAVAVVSALLTRRGQRLGDIVAGTMVIRDRKNVEGSGVYPFIPTTGLREWSRAMDTAALGDDGYQLIRDFLRREDLESRDHSELGRQIEVFVNGRLPQWPRPAGVGLSDWLTTIAARAQGAGATPFMSPPVPASRVGSTTTTTPPPPSSPSPTVSSFSPPPPPPPPPPRVPSLAGHPPAPLPPHRATGPGPRPAGWLRPPPPGSSVGPGSRQVRAPTAKPVPNLAPPANLAPPVYVSPPGQLRPKLKSESESESESGGFATPG